MFAQRMILSAASLLLSSVLLAEPNPQSASTPNISREEYLAKLEQTARDLRQKLIDSGLQMRPYSAEFREYGISYINRSGGMLPKPIIHDRGMRSFQARNSQMDRYNGPADPHSAPSSAQYSFGAWTIKYTNLNGRKIGVGYRSSNELYQKFNPRIPSRDCPSEGESSDGEIFSPGEKIMGLDTVIAERPAPPLNPNDPRANRTGHRRWLSPEYGCLQVKMVTRIYGRSPQGIDAYQDSVTELVSFTPGEPKAELFEIPDGYEWLSVLEYDDQMQVGFLRRDDVRKNAVTFWDRLHPDDKLTGVLPRKPLPRP